MKTGDHFIGYADNIVGNLKSKCRYLCCFKGIVDKFDKEERELLAKQEIITKSIEDAKRDDDVSIRDDVMKWLKQSKDLLKDDTEIKKACFWGWCPNCIWQYRKGKQLAQKTHDIRRLIGVATFEEGVVAPRTHHHLPGFKPYHNPDFIHFESQNLVYKQLLNELECDDSYMIGLCGMVGTGKTVLAIKVGSQLLESKKIDNLIYIADGHSNIKVIQQKIAEGLGLSLGNKDERERQKLLQKGLMNGGRILIIFDDVWEYINFEEIGIPSRDDDMMNCKILVISQNKRLVKSMGCPKPIQLGLLSDQEEWMLFQRFDIIEDNLDIALLQEIVKECEGLPVAILATGYVNARSVKPLDFYYLYERIKSEEAKKLFLLLSLFPKDTKIPVDMLTRFCNGVGLLIRDVAKYSSVSRSRILEVKDILLDSSLLLEDKEGYLKMHAFLHKVALHIAKEHIQVIKQFDIDHQALVATQEKMKNVRYLCCNDMQVVGGMDVFPSLFDVTILEVLLINIEASHHVKVPNEFFEKMTKLQVLFLSSNNTRTPKLGPLVLPPSIRSLTNIRYLLLCHWRLGDISILGKLQSLETLDLDDCTIHELPIEIIRLDKLTVLSLILCEIQKNNPFVVIECLSLKELYFRDNKFSTVNNYGNEVEAINHRSGYFPTLDRYHLQGGEASNSKCVCLPSIDALISEATFFKYLIRGAEILHLKEMSGEWKNLIPQFVPMEKNECMKDVLDLSLESCPRVECLINTSNCIESPIPSVFTKLVQLKLVNLGSLKELCCGSFPSESLECLVSLSIKYCVNLKGTLLKSELKLCNLMNIEIFRCPKLTSLFQLSIARSLDRLEELIIHDCYLMTSIIGEDNHHESFGLSFPKLKILEIKNCNKLECILPVIFPKAVPLLETIIIDDCIGLKYIFGHYQHEFQDVACGSLQKVKLRDGMSNCFNISLDAVKRSSPRICFKAKQKNSGISISQMSNSECSHNAGSTQCLLEQSPREFNILVLGNIKQLELTYLKEIKYLFALSTASSMMLEILLIRYCYELEHIIDIGDGNDRKKCDAIFPKLKQFSVHNCFRLKCMFGEYPLDHDDFKDIHIHLHVLEKLTLENLPNFSLSSMTWPPLKEFTVNQCPKFIINNLIGHKTINLDSRKPISTEDLKEVANLFGTLKNLSIIYNEVHNIICLSGVEIIGQVRLGLQYLKLYELHQLRHICLGSSINSFMFQNLKTIQIVRCYNLEVIFPASVLSYLPELERLEINKCHELKQIIEVAEDSAEDSKEIVTSSLIFSPRPQRPPCFQKLAVLVIHDCPKLKCLIPATQDVPNLVLLIVCEASVLEELIGGGGEHITGRDELPKLEGVMCMLSESLCDRGIELQTVKHRVIDSCPNLSHFSSTATVQEIKEKYSALLKDFEINWAYWRFISGPDEDTRVENADDEATIHLPVSP